MIIGMHGRLQAGKDTAMERLARLIAPSPVVHVSYARKLKESVAALFDISLEDIENWKTDAAFLVKVGYAGEHGVYHMPFRNFLQRYGTEAHRDVFGEDFWLDQALPLDRDYSDALYVVTDARFPNELKRIKDLGGTTVRIDGPLEFSGEHRSEVAQECDFVIDNRTRDDNFFSLDRQLVELLAETVAPRRRYTPEQIREAAEHPPVEGPHPMDIDYRFASQRPRKGDEIG